MHAMLACKGKDIPCQSTAWLSRGARARCSRTTSSMSRARSTQERRPRGERKSRGERERQPAEAVENKLNPQVGNSEQSAAPVPPTGNEPGEANGNEEQGNRRRGRRGGRGRSERRNEAETPAVAGNEGVPPAAEASATVTPGQEAVVVVIPAMPVVAEDAAPVQSAVAEVVASPADEAPAPLIFPVVETPVQAVAAPAVETQVPVVETTVAAVEAPAPLIEAPVPAVETAPLAVEPMPAAPEPIATLTVAGSSIETPAPAATIDIASALAESGLVLVQTTAAPIAVAPTEPPVKLGRPRKQKTVADQAEEPLVMVETGTK